MSQIALPPCWKKILMTEFQKDYMLKLKSFLLQQKQLNKTVYPQGSEYFSALNLTPFEDVKVVIIGQDPYHGAKQAHGLSFSVRKGIPLPPSLQNIYKELYSDLGITPPQHGFLESWAKQGVLLLNSVLTVEDSKPASHQGKGWEIFTDCIISQLSNRREGIAFILWGAYAQKKGSVIPVNKHLIIKSAHPSPLSAYRGFFGSRPFSKVNQYLIQQNKMPINWRIQN